MNLKELTWENHKNAERKKFASVLMSGKITPKLYYRYLTNQFYMYNILEARLRNLAPELGSTGVFRAEAIRCDMQELEDEHGFVFDPKLLSTVTSEYANHIENLNMNEDVDGLIAHMYVRHFGDMYGGAMIAKRVPGSGKMYQFEDKENLKVHLRDLLNDDMADEANRCFEYAIRLFEELGDYAGLGSSD